MEFLFAVFQVILLISLMQLGKTNSLCKPDPNAAKFNCEPIPMELIQKLDWPQLPCMLTACTNCITAMKTYILTDDGFLIEPSHFFDRPTARTGNVSTFTCVVTGEPRGDGIELPCDCDKNCTGSPEFCSAFQCDDSASCRCEVSRVRYELSHSAMEQSAVILNPTLISIEHCLYKLTSKYKTHRRHLLEFERATFSVNNLTLQFLDPVVTVPESGKLIARVSGNELIMDVKDDLNLVLPIEFTAYKQKLTLIFIASSGKAVYGDVILEGKSICRAANCFFCREFFLQLKCWPPYISYILYTVLFILLLTSICFLKWACQGLFYVFKCIAYVLLLVYRTFRAFLRVFLLMGAVFGSTARRRAINFYEELENRQVQFRAVQRNIPLILLLGCITLVAGDCTSHAILRSDTQNCKTTDGSRLCDLVTTAEITLNGLDFEKCIWFQDKTKNNVFHLKLRLVSAQCTFSTKRKYFTFPVTARTISQLACPQNYYCAWGEHCKSDTTFEAITEESLDYPGVTNCHPSSVGSGCTIISRMGCLFYRVYFVPDLLHSYEVRTILGHHCTYTIEVERAQNGSKELLTLQTTAQTADGIHIEILGSYNQPPLHITDSLVLRVGDPSEAYLVQTSPHGRPIAGLVGHIQSNSSYTKNFIFDRDMVRCDFFETTLRCETATDGLTAMTRTKDRALPLTRDLHLLTIDKGILKSRLLSTAPVRLQLTFKNFQIFIQNHDVCPKITSSDIRTKGCYSCQILATMVLTAVSNCHAGTVAVEFQILRLFTQTLFLGTEPKEFTIQFIAEQQCYDEKLCLVSRHMKHCHVFSFCLNEPSVNLIQLNTTYTRSFIKQDTAYTGIFSFISLPTVNTIFMSLKMIGGLLLIFCLTITIISTCVTCCRR